MDLDEYFGQSEKYFSESAGQLVDIAEMPFNRAYYSHMKLLHEYGDEYIGTELSNAFVRVLNPSVNKIIEQLRTYGKSCSIYRNSVGKGRSRFFKAGKNLGVKVTTHDTGRWFECTVAEVPQITVKSH